MFVFLSCLILATKSILLMYRFHFSIVQLFRFNFELIMKRRDVVCLSVGLASAPFGAEMKRRV